MKLDILIKNIYNSDEQYIWETFYIMLKINYYIFFFLGKFDEDILEINEGEMDCELFLVYIFIFKWKGINDKEVDLFLFICFLKYLFYSLYLCRYQVEY